MILREANLEDAPAIARVHIDTWRTAYRGLLPANVLADLSYIKREASWVNMLNTAAENNHFVYVAENEAGQIVGFADGGPERTTHHVYQGELYAIYILEGYQRKGIGRRLISSIVERLQSSGLHSMLVWVLVDNPAYKFYEALGGQKLHEKQIEVGGINFNEVAYGWTDTEVIIK